jgi:hypothetical protein
MDNQIEHSHNSSHSTNSDTSSDSENDIKINITCKDRSKMTLEELENYSKQFNECDFCISIHRSPEQYTGHTLEECRALKKIRCNFCGLCGHTGGRCKDRKIEDKPIQFNCSFCFRGNKSERIYMSHNIVNCRFRYEYNKGKKNFSSS